MKAAVLKAFGSPLCVEEVSEPIIGTGEVIVDMVATGLVSYAKEVFSGERRYLLETPIIPSGGGVGRVRATGPDATQLSVGDWVFCDPTVRSRDDVLAPDIILQGITAGSERALKLQRFYHDGSLAQRMLAPTENVFRLGDITPAEAPAWCRLTSLLVPFGGLLSIDLKAGEIVVVNGSTGKFGSSAVEVALAMGAACVIATGRNETVLGQLVDQLGQRVRPVTMSGDEATDRARIIEAAPGPIDCAFDILPPAASAAQVRAAILTVRPNGRISLMGGVGMQSGDDLALPYRWMMRNNITIRGQWMYPREAVPRMIAMIKAGLIDLSRETFACFALDHVNDAVAHAAANAGPFNTTIVCPWNHDTLRTLSCSLP